MDPFTIIILWFFFGILAWVIASGKGRSGFIWFLLATLLSPLVILLLLALPNLKEQQHHAEKKPRTFHSLTGR